MKKMLPVEYRRGESFFSGRNKLKVVIILQQVKYSNNLDYKKYIKKIFLTKTTFY